MENRLEKIVRRQRRYMAEDALAALLIAFVLTYLATPLFFQ